MITTVTASARAILKEMRSWRCSRSRACGEKLGECSKRWTTVGVCFRRCVTKKAAKLATTSAANTMRASRSSRTGPASATPSGACAAPATPAPSLAVAAGEVLDRVGSQAEAQRLEREHLAGRDVAEVALGP